MLVAPGDDRSFDAWLREGVVDVVTTDSGGLSSLPTVVRRARHTRAQIDARLIAEQKLMRMIGRADPRPLSPDQMKPTEAVLYALYDGVMCGVTVQRQEDGRFIDCNQEAVRVYGARDKADLLSKHPAELSPPSQPDGSPSWELAERYMAEAYERGSNQFEWTSRRFDGSEYVSETFLTAIDLGDQRVLMAVFVDITARKRTEEALRQSEEKYRRLVEGLENEYFFYTHDADGTVTYASPSVTQVLGYHPEDMQGRSFRATLADSPTNLDVDRFDREALEGGSPPVHEVEVLHADGETRLIEVLEVPVVDENGTVVSVEGIIRDISEQRKAEARIRRLNAELEERVHSRTLQLEGVVGELRKEVEERREVEAQLLASREQLRNLSTHLESVRETDRTRIAREIHDELGQNLTALRLDLSLVGRRLGEPDRAIQDRLLGMTGLVDETILSVRRICSELRPAVLDNLGLSAAMEWLLDDLGSRSSIQSRVVFSPEEIDVNPETGTAVFRVFQEAVTNVLRHAEAKALEVSLQATDDRLELTLEDDGIGISQDRMKDPSAFGIVGMKERVRAIGGQIDITGFSGKGTRIEVTVPLEAPRSRV